MAEVTVPSIDQSMCGDWTEQDRNQFNSLPIWLAKTQSDHKKWWSVFPKVMGTIPWQANMGKTMRAVRKEPSPHLRTFAFPQPICDIPTKDIIGIREATSEAEVYLHQFESQVFNFCPDFRDFMKDHVSATLEDIDKKILRFYDVFLRGYVFHQSVAVAFPNAADELVYGPQGTGSADGSTAKTNAWIAAKLPLIGNPGNLSVAFLGRVISMFADDMGVPYFSGSDMQTGENQGISGKYRLILSGEAYRQFTFDPYVLSNRPLSMNIVSDVFKGSPFNDTLCIIEPLPVRILLAGNGTISFPAPETVDLATNQTIPNIDYTAAQYEICWLCGSEGYKAITVGAPPRAFTSGYEPSNFAKLQWNGEVTVTKDILVPCMNGSTLVYDTNKYGRYLQMVAQLSVGAIGINKRNILPIIFKRQRGPNPA